jgi:hypothetical protein
MIYTVDFKVVLGWFIQWWSRELTQIDDMAIPCPLLHLNSLPPVAPETDTATVCARLCCHPQVPQDPPVEEKGGTALGLSPSLFLSLFRVSQALPLAYKREG